jgi:hypothetical protein
MAQRGMLPKIRPASLGQQSPGRPSIRPVKPSPMPPPPSPPRKEKVSIAVARKVISIGERTTTPQLEDPVTMTPETVEPETMAPSTLAYGSARGDAVHHFEDETAARRVDDYLLQSLKAEDKPGGDLGVAYDSLPSLEVKRPFDAYEAEFAERDPVTALVAAHESVRLRQAAQARAYEPAPVEDPYPFDHYAPQEPPQEPYFPEPEEHDDMPPTARGDASGPRMMPSASPRDYSAPPPAYDEQGSYESFQSGPQERRWSSMPPPPEPMIPQAPAVPRDFVQGVQPIRQQPMYGEPPPEQMMPMHPTAPPPMYGYQQPPQHYAYAQPQYAPQQQPMMMPRTQAPTGPAMMRQPVGPSLTVPVQPSSSRTLWFVFGAAFGIAFAFLATGFLQRMLKEPDPLFPPAPPAPTHVTAPPVAAPPPAAAPTTPVVVAQPAVAPAAPPPVSTAVVAPPFAAPVAAPPPVAAAPATAAPVAEKKPAPPVRRWTPPPPPRRQVAAAPKSSDDDAPPAPKKVAKPVDADPPASDGIKNVFGDALSP